MGLIKAALGATGGTLADQWKEFFYCESMPSDILVTKGQKRTSKRSSNTKGNDNVISNGSGVAVADGQCMIIVEQGMIVDVCAEPGEYTFYSGTEPSLFVGSLSHGIKDTFRTIGKRFTMGGDTGTDQRVYYFNTKELVDNKFGTPTPVPFRIVDRNIGLDVDISIRCNGVYSYKIVDPLLFYKNVCGNVDEEYNVESIASQLKGEFLNALQPAFAQISEMGVRYSALPGHTMELAEAMNTVLTEKWQKLRGLAIISVAINSVSASEEDEKMIKDLQKSAVMRDPSMAAAALTGAQADAMRAAAANTNGAMAGFMGMGFAQNSGGMNASELYRMGAQQGTQPAGGLPGGGQFAGGQFAAADAPAAQGGWDCAACGHQGNKGKFCEECGGSKPAAVAGWNCPACGAAGNKGKFCAECGKPRPAGAPVYVCDKCGWQPEDPQHPPKFCPECGDKFNEEDLK